MNENQSNFVSFVIAMAAFWMARDYFELSFVVSLGVCVVFAGIFGAITHRETN